MTERYIELHSSSAFSFLEGASQPDELIKRAVELEMPAMALLDRNGVYGAARFHTSAKRNDVQAHVGAEIAVSSFGNRLTPPAWLPHLHPAEPARLPLLCETRIGYQNLCQLITRFKIRESIKCEGAATSMTSKDTLPAWFASQVETKAHWPQRSSAEARKQAAK
jgi:error-prone DNA polymerase